MPAAQAPEYRREKGDTSAQKPNGHDQNPSAKLEGCADFLMLLKKFSAKLKR